MTLRAKLENLQQIAKERTVKTQNIEYDLETLVKKIKKNVIQLNPDYQRRHRWSDDYSSRLIESLILNIPVPLIYLSQDIDVDDEVEEEVARYSVIDGQQRLTAIANFFQNEFELSGLSVLEELNGAYYKDLPPFLVRRLEERTLRCLRIDSTFDDQVKYDIFERLNSGSIKLEPQELRNAVCRGAFNTLVKELSEYTPFREAINLSKVREDKMEDQELIVRYFALTHGDGYNDYKGKFKEFLTSKMREFNALSKPKLKKMGQDFKAVIDAAVCEFGEYPFAKYREEGKNLKIVSRFNAAVFDSIIVSFAVKPGSAPFNKKKFTELFRDADYFSAVDGATQDVAKVKTRIEKALMLV